MAKLNSENKFRILTRVVSIIILMIILPLTVVFTFERCGKSTPPIIRPTQLQKDSIRNVILALQQEWNNGYTADCADKFRLVMGAADSLNDAYGRIVSRMNLGFYDVESNNDYLGGMDMLREAYCISQDEGKERLGAIVICNIALLDGLRGYDDSLGELEKVHEYGKSHSDKYITEASAQILSILKSEQGAYGEALKYANEANELADAKSHNRVEIYTAYASSLSGLKRMDEAREWFALAIRDSVGAYADSKIFFHVRYGQFLLDSGESAMSVQELLKGEVLSNEKNSYSWRLQLYASLITAYEHLGKAEEALVYEKRLNNFIRSTHDASRERELVRQYTQLQESGLNRELGNARRAMSNQKILLSVLILAILVILIICVRLLRHKSKSRRVISRLIMRKNSSETRLKETLSQIEQLRNDGNKKYKGSSLTPQLEKEIYARLKDAMEDDKVFLDTMLNKEKLAKICMTNESYLSQVVNNLEKVSVSEYINRARARYARCLIDENPGIDISSLPMQSGFNSSTTFYRAFKSEFGMTASQYIKSHTTS